MLLTHWHNGVAMDAIQLGHDTGWLLDACALTIEMVDVNVSCPTRRSFELVKKWEREVILVSVLETGLPGIAQTAGSDHDFSICCPNSD